MCAECTNHTSLIHCQLNFDQNVRNFWFSEQFRHINLSIYMLTVYWPRELYNSFV